MGTIFPLFTQQMYSQLTYHWGTALFGFIAVLMIPIPFVRRSVSTSLVVAMSLTSLSSLGPVLEGARHPRAQQVRVASRPQAVIHTAMTYARLEYRISRLIMVTVNCALER